MDSAEAAQWAVAGTTLLAVLLALWAEIGNRRRVTKAEEREQARQVAAWWDEVEPHESDLYTTAVVRVRNGSHLPIYQIHVEYDGRPQTTTTVLNPAILPPGHEHSRPISLDHVEAEAARKPLRVRFTDADGRRWIRDPDGGLRQP